MRARLATETAIDVMKINVTKMSNLELIECAYEYMNRKDDEGKEILKIIEAEIDKMHKCELIDCAFKYLFRKDHKGKAILKLIEVEKDKKRIY